MIPMFLAPAILLSDMYIFAPGIFIAKKTHFQIWINVGRASVNALLNYMLIPILGIKGAGLATMICNLLSFLAYIMICQKYYPIPYQWKRLITLTIIAVSLIIIMTPSSSNNLLHSLIKLLAITVFVLTSIKIGFEKHETTTVKGIVLSLFSLSKTKTLKNKKKSPSKIQAINNLLPHLKLIISDFQK